MLYNYVEMIKMLRRGCRLRWWVYLRAEMMGCLLALCVVLHVCRRGMCAPVLCTSKDQDAFCPVWGALEHDVQLAAHDHR